MTQQLAGLMGMQGMGMQGMVSCSPNLGHSFESYLFTGWDGRRHANEQFTALFDVGGHARSIHAHGAWGNDGGECCINFENIRGCFCHVRKNVPGLDFGILVWLVICRLWSKSGRKAVFLLEAYGIFYWVSKLTK